MAKNPLIPFGYHKEISICGKTMFILKSPVSANNQNVGEGDLAQQMGPKLDSKLFESSSPSAHGVANNNNANVSV